uniref:Uncharacterized protein n=1 Tax=Panagrolaimus sp. ES5 TaxID=591445 RepID=A0AC34G0G5_9BILA
MAMPQMSPNNGGFGSTVTTRTSYIPTTPQLRRYTDYTNPSVSPQMPRRSSPSKSNYGRMSPTKQQQQQQQNYGHSSFKSAPLSDCDSVQLPQILALNFLAEGKYVRTVAVFVWFLSFICFIFLIQSTIHIVALELIPKIVATSVGIIVAIICLYAAVQSLYQICRIDYVVPTHFSMDERYDLDAVGGHYARGNNNFSTLV